MLYFSPSRCSTSIGTLTNASNLKRIAKVLFVVVKFVQRIQLFRQRLSHKSVKAYATMPIGIMGRKSFALID